LGTSHQEPPSQKPFLVNKGTFVSVDEKIKRANIPYTTAPAHPPQPIQAIYPGTMPRIIAQCSRIIHFSFGTNSLSTLLPGLRNSPRRKKFQKTWNVQKPWAENLFKNQITQLRSRSPKIVFTALQCHASRSFLTFDTTFAFG
jgi:hypothetical protein